MEFIYTNENNIKIKRKDGRTDIPLITKKLVTYAN